MRRNITIDEFRESIKAPLLWSMPGEAAEKTILQNMDTNKQNGQKRCGLLIKQKETCMAPVFYLEDHYRRFQAGEDFHSLAKEIADEYESTLNTVSIAPDLDLSWSYAEKHLAVKVLEAERNKDYLQDKAYGDAGNGLVILPMVYLGPDDEPDLWAAPMNEEMLESFETDIDTVVDMALSNAAYRDKPVLRDLEAAALLLSSENLLERSRPVESCSPAYVLSTESGINGAAALFYPNVMHATGAVLGGVNYYVLPSSIHEVIITPESEAADICSLHRMVKEANRTVVEPCDILSDCVYFYNIDTRSLSVV